MFSRRVVDGDIYGGMQRLLVWDISKLAEHGGKHDSTMRNQQLGSRGILIVFPHVFQTRSVAGAVSPSIQQDVGCFSSGFLSGVLSASALSTKFGVENSRVFAALLVCLLAGLHLVDQGIVRCLPSHMCA